MNDTMKFFKAYASRVTRIINKVTKTLLEDEHIVIHPTAITTNLIDSFHHNNSDTNVLEVGSIYRITKDLPHSNTLYLLVVYKRYGSTYKPKKLLLLARNMITLADYCLDDTIVNITMSIMNIVNSNL